MYVQTKDLPTLIKTKLKAVGYNRADIEIKTANSISPQYHADDGSRGYFCVVNLTTGTCTEHYGSWGGPNMFVTNVVDDFKGDVTLPINHVAIRGCVGGKCFLTLYACKETVTPILPLSTITLSKDEEVVLWAHKGLKGGDPRREHYRRNGLSPIQVEECIRSLVGKKLLKMNKAKSTSITTQGRNAASNLKEY